MSLISHKTAIARSYIGKFGIQEIYVSEQGIIICVKDVGSFINNGHYETIKTVINDSRIEIIVKKYNPYKPKYRHKWWTI